jgi:membrane protease YdiL (CAAX protease family)
VLNHWSGALPLGCGGVFLYLLLGQGIPAVAVTLWLIQEGGVGALFSSPAELERRLAEFVPHIVLGGVPFAILLVVAARGLRLLRPPPTPVRRRLAWIVGLSIVCFAGQLALSTAMAAGAEEGGTGEQPILLEAAKHGSVLFALAVMVGAPLAEELVFRRFFFGNLRGVMDRPTAYLITALVFAAIHGHPPAIPLYVWMSFCFTAAYEKTGSVWGAFAVHAINNGVALCFMGQ